MNSYQFGKAGITLLAVYGIVAAALAGIEVLESAVVITGKHGLVLEELLVTVSLALGAALAFGVLPAALLIWRRHSFARRWCASDDAATELGLSTEDLLRVGLVLLGVSSVITGVLMAVGSTVSGGVTMMAFGGEAQKTVPTTAGQFVRAVAQIGIGILLVKGSRNLAGSWR